jgi:hypothetical protein
MSPQVIQSGLGIEEIMDAMALVLISDVNEALQTVYDRRALRDQELADAKGIEFEPIILEEIIPTHIHVGNFPKLVFDEVPPENYPYLALTLEDYSPDPEDASQDHMNVTRDAIVVHSLAKATESEGGEIVFRRAVRMAEAVFICLASNLRTQRLLSGLSNPTRGRASVPWKYQHQGHGKEHWFQAIGTQYAIKSYTSLHQ